MDVRFAWTLRPLDPELVRNARSRRPADQSSSGRGQQRTVRASGIVESEPYRTGERSQHQRIVELLRIAALHGQNMGVAVSAGCPR
ncbi:MAG: hypothetical protein ABI323_14430 [Solirubrobacteraceae bacterium]